MPKYIVILPFVFLQGCALTAQTVNLHPKIETLGPASAKQHTIQLEVVDSRPSPVIGYRDGATKNAPLTATDGLLPAITDAVTEGLTKEGYTVSTGKSEQSVVLRLELLALDYHVQVDPRYVINTQAIVKANIPTSANGFQKTFIQKRFQQWVTTPSLSNNEEILNDTLADALSSILRDNELLSSLK